MTTGCAKPVPASPRAEHENQEVLNPASYKERGTHMLLVGNGRVITRDENNPYFQAGAVAIDGEKIVAVGGEADLKEQYLGAEYVDAQGGIIMPGLVNAHTHIYSGLARGLAIKGCDPKNFLDNLEMQWWKIDRNLDLDATRAQVRCRRRSYLRRHGAWRGRCLWPPCRRFQYHRDLL